MNKLAVEVTLVLVDMSENYRQLTQYDLTSALIGDKLEYYGEYVDSANGKPIVYLTYKKEVA